MQLNRPRFLVLGTLALGLGGCPEPTNKANRPNEPADMGGSSSGSGGGSGGNAGRGGSGGGSGGSMGGSGGGSGGSMGGSGGGSGMDAAARGGSGGGMGGMTGGMDMGRAGAGGGGMDARGGAGSGMDMARAGDGAPAGAASFKTDIFPILMKSCTGCHGGMGLAGMGEQGAYTYLQMNHAGMCNGMTLKRCQSLQYKLDPASMVMCGNKMPKGQMGIMDTAAIAKLKAWATAGCPM